MPKQAKQKRNPRKAKRRDAVAKIRGMPQVRTIFPDRLTGWMPYSDQFNFAVVDNSIAANVFRLNSIFDPDYSGTGRSVGGYAQASALYGKYRVMTAKVTIDCDGTRLDVATHEGRAIMYAVVSNDLTLGVSPSNFATQRHVISRPVRSGDGFRVSFTVPIGSSYGVSQNAVSTEDDWAALFGGNPNNQVMLHVGFFASANGNSINVAFGIRIDYHVRLELPKALA